MSLSRLRPVSEQVARPFGRPYHLVLVPLSPLFLPLPLPDLERYVIHGLLEVLHVFIDLPHLGVVSQLRILSELDVEINLDLVSLVHQVCAEFV